jgi:hypothetical protein
LLLSDLVGAAAGRTPSVARLGHDHEDKASNTLRILRDHDQCPLSLRVSIPAKRAIRCRPSCHAPPPKLPPRRYTDFDKHKTGHARRDRATNSVYLAPAGAENLAGG